MIENQRYDMITYGSVDYYHQDFKNMYFWGFTVETCSFYYNLKFLLLKFKELTIINQA